MTLETILQQYGYIALFIGTFLEGETILILAGFAAHRGYMDLSLVWLIAFIGAFCGDQFFFFLGRFKGQALLSRRPGWQPKVERVDRFIDRFKIWIIFGVRFLYGLRIVGPIAIGMSGIGAWRFVAINFASGIVWAVIFGTIGYMFGTAFEIIFGNVEKVEKYIFLGIILVSILIYFIHLLWGFKKKSGYKNK